MKRVSSCVAGMLVLACASNAHAQERLAGSPAAYLGWNILIGGASALTQSFLGSDAQPARALLNGALGGAVTWGGQRLAGGGPAGTRLAGVQLAALGSNIARNAGRGVPVLSDVVLPFYPLYIRIRAADATPVSARISVIGTVALVLAARDAGQFQATLDWEETLLTGGPVFRSRSTWIYPFGQVPAFCHHGDGCEGAAAGLHRAGVTWYTTGGRSGSNSRRIIAHETIHLTQMHRDALLHAIPMSDAILSRVGGPVGALGAVFVVDAYLPLMGLNQLVSAARPAGGRFYEMEAAALTGR
jgi:hypothetical protein